MFWDKAFAPSANIEALLEKENVTVEEFLDDEDILQECKTQKKNIINYFTRPEIIKRLIELVITEPSEELPMTQRFRYANMACEILSIGLPSLNEKLLSDAETLQLLYSYLENEPPLNPLLSSFFSKTFSMLFTKKAEQDWFLYQQMCLQLLEYLKTQKNFLNLICKHFDTPVIPDLIMQMMKDVEGGQLKRNLYEWLTEDKLVERLIAILRNPQETDKHANVAEFFCDLIHQGRSMRQTEQENDSFEPAFESSNPILKNIESSETIEALLNVILEPNAQESAILSGILVVLMLIKPITFTDEPNSDRQKYLQNRERELHLMVQETVINVIAPRLKDFVDLLKNPPAKATVETTVCTLAPPFGKTRLQICRVFTALLETKHETISNAVCATDYFSLLLDYFKQYCWNNFLHSELEKALQIVFYTQFANGNNFNSTAATENSYEKHMTNDDYVFNCFMKTDDDEAVENAKNAEKRAEGGAEDDNAGGDSAGEDNTLTIEELSKQVEAAQAAVESSGNENKVEADAAESENNEKQQMDADVPMPEAQELLENRANIAQVAHEIADVSSEHDKTKVSASTPPSELQMHLIVKCRLISHLIDYWQYNNTMQNAENGRRLGYMGHLIKILKHITNSILESEHIGALIDSNLSDETESRLWQTIVNPENGEFTMALNTQTKHLANFNPYEENDFDHDNPLGFLGENCALDFITRACANRAYDNDVGFAIDDDQNLFQFVHNIDDDEEDEDENVTAGGGDGHGLYAKNSLNLSNLAASGSGGSPWDTEDPFSDLSTIGTTNVGTMNWGDNFTDNFADFDAHFSTFCNDMGLQFGGATDDEKAQHSSEILPVPRQEQSQSQIDANEVVSEGSANNAEINVRIDDQKSYESNELGNLSANSTLAETEMATVTATATATAEYDNNANVEKRKFIEAELPAATSPTVSTSLVSRLQSVLLDGEEDYEDDEGMWTKPLGDAAVQAEQAADEHQQQATSLIMNGPSGKQVEELNNAITNINTSEKQQEQLGLEQKRAANTNTNNFEITTT